jgi:hypothetical protein
MGTPSSRSFKPTRDLHTADVTGSSAATLTHSGTDGRVPFAPQTLPVRTAPGGPAASSVVLAVGVRRYPASGRGVGVPQEPGSRQAEHATIRRSQPVGRGTLAAASCRSPVRPARSGRRNLQAALAHITDHPRRLGSLPRPSDKQRASAPYIAGPEKIQLRSFLFAPRQVNMGVPVRQRLTASVGRRTQWRTGRRSRKGRRASRPA